MVGPALNPPPAQPPGAASSSHCSSSCCSEMSGKAVTSDDDDDNDDDDDEDDDDSDDDACRSSRAFAPAIEEDERGRDVLGTVVPEGPLGASAHQHAATWAGSDAVATDRVQMGQEVQVTSAG
eukprot:CAMPEP_0170752156 /NCGR_PEP_ID=MMETSP0437-20130122/11824_1 /TAXON_ID=0 /ORGANISM="Sexangularia sp." /LENGTH=122 /DNA_ID=CAMNT_0011091219 /DNA_START=77 /DNA_END=446 /DNA_ORIENTATION=+